MKIALVGYGKMGHMLEQAAIRDGHEVVTTIDVVADDAKVKVAQGDTEAIVRAVKSSGAEGIIEFSHPSAVLANIKALLKRVMEGYPEKTEMVFDAFHERPAKNQLHVSSTRCGNIPGTHKVFFDGIADTIELTHTARSREGFATGAVQTLVKLDNALKTGKLSKGNLYFIEDVI